MTALLWFRNDLRLSDNPALSAAADATHNLIPVYILDNSVSRSLGAAQQWWLYHSLTALRNALKRKGVTLVLKKGNSKKILVELAKKYKAEAVYWNRSYDPLLMKRDADIEKHFVRHDINVHTFNGSLLTEPADVKNKSGEYFKVYTPYWRSVLEVIGDVKPLPTPRKLVQQSKVTSHRIESWRLLPKNPDWSKGFKIWKVGERAAKQVLKRFVKSGLKNYDKNRDRPDLLGTSHLSPYLHFGEISIWQVWDATKQNKAFLRQLIWREFCQYVLFHFPQLGDRNYKKEFNALKWKKSQKKIYAWQKGLTGYPIVDAGMRELWATGYMHNRVRMIVASFLTKDLLIDWSEGERWFWDTLLDADSANNAFGWQWVAGTGLDAAPYFRVFNPTLQGKKFDPNGEYVLQWVPELAKLPKKYIHEPSNAPKEILKKSAVQLGENYPLPIVDHKKARIAALGYFKKLK